MSIKTDSENNMRLLIVGNSGSGKSTFADALGKLSNFPVLHLDKIHWRPNWEQTPREELRESVEDFILKNPNWVIDGNYGKTVGDLTLLAATNVVWLDPPFILYFPRLLWRTFARLLGFKPPCSPGCNESLKDIFTLGKKSIIWWCWTQHTPTRKKHELEMLEDKDGRWIRLGGWGKAAEDFQKRLKKFLQR